MGVKIYDQTLGAFKDANNLNIYKNGVWTSSEGMVYKNGAWQKVLPSGSPVEIVPFTTGTNEQISAMLDAYYDNQITLAQMGWKVGDVRTVSYYSNYELPYPDNDEYGAQYNHRFVIVATEHTDLATPINGHTKACITVQLLDVINDTIEGTTAYYAGVNDYNKTFIPWSNLYLRNYLEDKIFQGRYFQDDFKSLIKTSKHYRSTNKDGTSVAVVNDNLFLPSYPEVFGTESYTYYSPTSPVEGTQFKYYETASNRKKYFNFSEAVSWWLGSTSNDYRIKSIGYGWLLANYIGTGGRVWGNSPACLSPAWAM